MQSAQLCRCHTRETNSALHHSSANKLFRINTSKSVSKQMTLSVFGMSTYEKLGGRGALLLTRVVEQPPLHRMRILHAMNPAVSCPSHCHRPRIRDNTVHQSKGAIEQPKPTTSARPRPAPGNGDARCYPGLVRDETLQPSRWRVAPTPVCRHIQPGLPRRRRLYQ
jgi:hypothetical protein